jgi:hypothetical protein
MEEPNPRISGFLKEQYQKELDRKNDYTGRITLMSGILTILGGGLLAMAREIAIPNHSNEWIEGATVAASLIFAGISAWWVWSAFTYITYLAIPSSDRGQEPVDSRRLVVTDQGALHGETSLWLDPGGGGGSGWHFGSQRPANRSR